MAFKEYDIEGIGPLKVYKRQGSRSLRLSIQPDGTVRVSIPSWTPYAAGVSFAKSRQSWITQHAHPTAEPFKSGQTIGKTHQLLFKRSLESSRISTRVRHGQIVITYPATLTADDAAVQTAAQKASIRALHVEAKAQLPGRLQALAAQHGFSYGSLTIKPLKTRWGSCDQDQNITLNIYLMQLPWHLIDYVLLHELTHTRIMQHGQPFWEAMSRLLPNVTAIRKEMRKHRSALRH